MRIATELAVTRGERLEIHMRKRIGRPAAGLQAEPFQQMLADQMGGLPIAQIHAGLAEIDWQELRVDVGNMKQGNITERRQLIELGGLLGLARARPQARARRRTED